MNTKANEVCKIATNAREKLSAPSGNRAYYSGFLNILRHTKTTLVSVLNLQVRGNR